MANSERSVIASSVPSTGSRVSTAAVSGRSSARANRRERPIEHPERDEHADADESHELDDGFGRDRQHQAVLVLGRVDVPCAEQHREDRHGQRAT